MRRALCVALFLAIVSELSGVTVVFYYGPGILEKAGFSLGDALGGFVSIGVVNTVFTVIAIWLMDSVGRRPCFLLHHGSFLRIGVDRSPVSVWLYGRTVDCCHDVPLCCMLCLLHGTNQVGSYVRDFSDTHTRARRGNCHTGRMGDRWRVQPALPDGSKQSWMAGSFLIFAAVLVPQFFFIWKVMPETGGRSLEQMSDRGRNKLNPARV